MRTVCLYLMYIWHPGQSTGWFANHFAHCNRRFRMLHVPSENIMLWLHLSLKTSTCPISCNTGHRSGWPRNLAVIYPLKPWQVFQLVFHGGMSSDVKHLFSSNQLHISQWWINMLELCLFPSEKMMTDVLDRSVIFICCLGPHVHGLLSRL